MVAVASSSGDQAFGSLSKRSNASSLLAPRVNRCLAVIVARSSSDGSTSSTVAPECSTMYSTSSARSRKLIGTRTRPDPGTAKNSSSSRPALGETTATRSPTSTPSSSSPACRARTRRAKSRYVSSPSESSTVGSSITPIRSPNTCTARSRKSDVEKGTFMGSDLSADGGTHQCRQDVTDRLTKDSVSNAVVRGCFGVDDDETGARRHRNLTQSRSRLHRQGRTDRDEQVTALRRPPRGLQHLGIERLTE